MQVGLFSHCVEGPLFSKLPDEFHEAIPTLQEADLLIVMGTSLTVHPFAMLAELVPKRCPRSVCSRL
jgi:NAD-dependent SIR2 family protein deacetylase